MTSGFTLHRNFSAEGRFQGRPGLRGRLGRVIPQLGGMVQQPESVAEITRNRLPEAIPHIGIGQEITETGFAVRIAES